MPEHKKTRTRRQVKSKDMELEVKETGLQELDARVMDEETSQEAAAGETAGPVPVEGETGAAGGSVEGETGAAGGSVEGEAPAAEPSLISTPDDEIEELRQELSELRDRCMRTLADFDNYRKRVERERIETRKYALFEPVREILPVVDNLERAVASAGSAEDLRAGVEMILRQLQGFLNRHGVREVKAVGEEFNPAYHEAISREEDPTVTTPTVMEELQRGYLMGDRLLRPALVKVAVPVEAPEVESEAQESEEASQEDVMTN